MALARASVHEVEWFPQNASLQCLCLQGEFQLPPASPRSCLRSVGGSDPGSLKLLLLPWVLECVRFCVCLLRVESLSHSAQALLKLSLTGLQSQTFWGLIFLVQGPGLGSRMWSSDPSLLGENLYDCNCLPICRLPTQVCGSWLFWISAPLIYLVVVSSLYL